MIGRKSISKTFAVGNIKNKKAMHLIKVQANRNYGICDIIFPCSYKEPTSPKDTSNGELVRAYNALKKEYEFNMRSYKETRSYFLNLFQGQQLNSAEVCANLYHEFFKVLNHE